MEQDGEKLLLFGGKPSRYLSEWEITSDLALAERKLDVRFEEVPQAELVARYESLDEDGLMEASGLAQDLVKGALPHRKRQMPPPPYQEDIAKAMGLYVTMKQIVDEREGDAVTIACGPWIRGEGLPTPCVALMLFQEQGVPAACQGDIDALLTMILFNRVAGLPSFMGGAIKVRGHLGISHCVLCRHMLGAKADLQPYQVSDYHGRKAGPTVWTGVPVGEVATVARLTRNLKSLLLATGTVVASDTSNSRCRNVLAIEVPDRERVFRAVKGVQNHYVVALGDHVPALSQLAEAKDIEVDRLDQP
jgi:L-fucose isomerase-like protein